MHFTRHVACDVLKASYNRETLEVTYMGKNIYQVLDMTAQVFSHTDKKLKP